MLKRLFTILFLLAFSLAQAKEIKILSFDGGGIRGAASLKILQDLQGDTNVKFSEDFDVFAGTSTGSILAVSLACGMDVNQILKDYEEMSAGVFSDASYMTLFDTKYSPDKLRAYLLSTLKKCGYDENSTLNHLPKKVVVLTVSLDDAKEGRWKMEVRENITREGGKVKILDALLESTAAPTYFPSEKGCVDGGIAMKDPSLAAVMAVYNPDINDLKDIKVLSIGTGYNKDFVKGEESWGEEQWMVNMRDQDMGTVPILSMIMDVEDQIPEQMCSKLLGKSYKKFDFLLTERFALDDYTQIAPLIQYLEQYIKSHPSEWTDTCTWVKALAL